MAIIDSKLEFFDGVTITAISGATQDGTNVTALDESTATLKNAWGTTITPDIGEGGNLVMNCRVGTAFSSSNSFKVKLYHHTASGVTSGSVLGYAEFGSGTGDGSAGKAGSRQNFRLPTGTINKWIGAQVSMVTGGSGAGTLDVWIGMDTETPTE